MRTTLAIDDDMIDLARAIADRDRRTMGEVVSDLMRKGLESEHRTSSRTRNGLPLLPTRGRRTPVTLDLVNRLRDEMP